MKKICLVISLLFLLGACTQNESTIPETNVTTTTSEATTSEEITTTEEVTVLDVTPPVIFGLDDLTYTIGNDEPDYSANITASDDIDGYTYESFEFGIEPDYILNNYMTESEIIATIDQVETDSLE